jgi:hypothetical protein
MVNRGFITRGTAVAKQKRQPHSTHTETQRARETREKRLNSSHVALRGQKQTKIKGSVCAHVLENKEKKSCTVVSSSSFAFWNVRNDKLASAQEKKRRIDQRLRSRRMKNNTFVKNHCREQCKETDTEKKDMKTRK